ncbi:TPA: hypothetical protein ACK2XP_005355 [Klebsiella oxytoca]|nr:hypothetical protein [Citrobacter freundii]
MSPDNGLPRPTGLSNPSSVQKPVLNRRGVFGDGCAWVGFTIMQKCIIAGPSVVRMQVQVFPDATPPLFRLNYTQHDR